jgi:hypothetical protein
MVLELAVALLTQVKELVNNTLTTSPLDKLLLLNVLDVAPDTSDPFTRH